MGPWSTWAPLATLLLIGVMGAGAPVALSQGHDHPDLCLEIVTDGLPDGAWEQVIETVMSESVTVREGLFPAPAVEATETADPASGASPSARMAVHSGHTGGSVPGASAACLQEGLDWTVRFDRAFLTSSAAQMLADAPTTPGIRSEVSIEWHPRESRVRTLLTFAGPLDIPNGRCWVDDVLTIDETTGIAVSSGDQGLETSPFAEGACGRFFSYLPDGGAGEQAITLLPTEVLLDDGTRLRFISTEVTVTEEGIAVGGVLDAR